jgi:hypothetical protein
MKPKWYIEITWSVKQASDEEILGEGVMQSLGLESGNWTETTQTCHVMRGIVEEVVGYLIRQISTAHSAPRSFRAIPFEESPVRNIEAYQKL